MRTYDKVNDAYGAFKHANKDLVATVLESAVVNRIKEELLGLIPQSRMPQMVYAQPPYGSMPQPENIFNQYSGLDLIAKSSDPSAMYPVGVKSAVPSTLQGSGAGSAAKGKSLYSRMTGTANSVSSSYAGKGSHSAGKGSGGK